MSQADAAFDGHQPYLSLQSEPTFSPLASTSNNPSSRPDGGYRSARKAAPSPLQSSITSSSFAATPARQGANRRPLEPSSPISPRSPRSPRSPKEQLDDLLATERTFFKSADSSPDSSPGSISKTIANTDTNANSRSVSDSIVGSKTGESSIRRPQMSAAAAIPRPNMPRAPPRTSSIDSAISTISATSSTQKSSQDSNGPTPADITNLIQAAGSPEAVIQYLLKEKQSQSTQNAQLWRLVDKQRAMILGLNKDLERALKDKETYRKKLKDSLARLTQAPAVSTTAPSPDTASETSTQEVPKAESMVAIVSAGLRDAQPVSPHSPIDVALAPYPVTPPHMKDSHSPLPNLVEAEHKMPSSREHALDQFDPDAPTEEEREKEKEKKKAVDVTREIPYNASLPPSRTLPPNPPRPSEVGKAPGGSSSNLTMAAPSAPPMRKPPPAPLNLSNSELRSRVPPADDNSESDYDDLLEVNEIPKVDRGRRRTREDDDRERELAALKSAELRGSSKKSKSSGKSPEPLVFVSKEAGQPTQDPLPLSPRQAVQISPPDVHMRQFSPETATGSLAGILSGAGQERVQTIPAPLMSPGLPSSPRPMDRGMASPLPRNPRDGPPMASPPLSPRMGGFPTAAPLSPRAPRAPIPLPPNTPMSLASPTHHKAEPLNLASPKPLQIKRPSVSHGVKEESPIAGRDSPIEAGIFRGFMIDEFPDLLLPPHALPSIAVKVASSRLKPSRASLISPNRLDEDPVFTLAIFSRSDGRELWRVEKDSLSLSHLDQLLKQSPHFVAKTPEKSLFSGHAPAKVDARRVALDNYLDEMLNTPFETQFAIELCRYLSTNAMPPLSDQLHSSGDSIGDSPERTGPGGRTVKNGYLTKRGKNFGGWKARFFVLDGPVLKYYESPGGPHLGAIKLQNAQIGKQQKADNASPSRDGTDDPDNEYRHAFLILEPKRKDSTSLVRHVLCAESDKERDQWVEALLQYVDFRDSEDEERSASRNQVHASATGQHKKRSHPKASAQSDYDDGLKAVSYESTVQGDVPRGISRQANTPTPSPQERETYQHAPKTISAPKNATIIQDAGAWGMKSNSLAPAVDEKKQKKRSFFGFGTKPRNFSDVMDHAQSNDSNTNLAQMAYEQHGPIRPVFGAPLAEAVHYNHPADRDIELPAVVYRCIEYLDAKNAVMEEGIFRLSGSNVVIKSLRERFNVEGDINLVTDEQYYDIHAVASLLKLYLRELPSTVLTRELHLEFVAVTELSEMQEKISALRGLVRRLPQANSNLLRYLTGFLINIINHADVNKMTVRNVGIVFSPTLNIPPPVFALFLQQYDPIFGDDQDLDSPPVEVTVTAPPMTPEDIRSPRRQKFQELPTPSYDQNSFPMNGMSYQQQQQRMAYETGFAPTQMSYEQSYNTLAGPEYGRGASTMAGPAYEQLQPNGAYRGYEQASQQQPMTKAKRRESSMFAMGFGGPKKQPSYNKMRENKLVDEESFFE